MYATKEKGVVDIDLEEGVTEVDVGLPVKQCVEWALGRGMGWILVESHKISSY